MDDASARPAPAAVAEQHDEPDEYRLLCRARRRHLVAVREPLILISQIERSGGTLLSQLFDGHAECHSHPHELGIGYPKSRIWPRLDLDRPESWYPTLAEKAPAKHLRHGYRKFPAKRREAAPGDIYPFLFLPSLQRQVFDHCARERTIHAERDVLDCYFTSYFNAWLDNHNLYTGPKKAVVGFVPRLHMGLDQVEAFFGTYPDGLLVSLVRDPRAWFASLRTAKSPDASVEEGLRRWRASAEATLAARERWGARVVVSTYEQLVLDTEPTMRRLAERIGISMTPTLLEPTFNGLPIRANSAVAVGRHGILQERAESFRDVLDPETIRRIEALAGDLYERAAAVSLSHA
jgi:hypothetical protein